MGRLRATPCAAGRGRFRGDTLARRARGGRPVTDRDRIVKITEIQEISPLPISELQAALPRRHRDVMSRSGILPPAGGNAVIGALKQLLPVDADLIDHLQRPLGFRLPEGPRGELLNQERDGLGLLLDIADVGRQPFLHSWSPTSTDVPFLVGIPDRTELEDHLIAHDIERFSSWFPAATNQLAWRAFRSGSRRVFIMNANRTPVEHTLGVDVVYWNENEGSFVLVQYKKMQRENGEDAEDTNYLAYRPDNNLESELERMRRVDVMCLKSVRDFRLSAAACWLKLCDPQPRLRDPSELIRGMYLAREHFEKLLETCRGPRGGVRLSYENVSRYLSNTIFIELVRDGWIGSSGVGTQQVRELIRESIETRHAVLFGVQSDPR